MFMLSSTSSDLDTNFEEEHGSDDTFLTLGSASQSWMLTMFKRKFITGDNNRDIQLNWGANTFCFLLGKERLYRTFEFTERVCLDITVENAVTSRFRIS